MNKARELTQRVIDEVHFPGYLFYAEGLNDDRAEVYASYDEPDVDTGDPATQYTRSWIIEEDWDEGQIVRTALKAVLTSLEHRAREHFTYKGKAVFGPHPDMPSLLTTSPTRTKGLPDPGIF